MTTRFKLEDLARLAAYIDGEGHISVSVTGNRPTPSFKMQMTIVNTDVRLMVWLASTFGGEYRSKMPTKKGRRAWYWYISANKASSLLSACLPYFVMKRDQAEIAIAYQDEVNRYAQGKRGRRLNPETIVIRKDFSRAIQQARENAAPVIN